MPTYFADETEVCNAALSTIGERPLSDYATDTTKVAIECRRWLPATIGQELMKYDWPFAIVRASLTKDATDPAFGWTSRYQIPTDCVRFFPITDDGEDTGNPVPHEVEGGYILVDQTADLNIRYVQEKRTVTDWPMNFTEVVIAALAYRLCENIAGLSQALPSAQQRYTERTEMVRRFEGRQTGTTPEPYSSTWFEDRA